MRALEVFVIYVTPFLILSRRQVLDEAVHRRSVRRSNAGWRSASAQISSWSLARGRIRAAAVAPISALASFSIIFVIPPERIPDFRVVLLRSSVQHGEVSARQTVFQASSGHAA